MKLFSREIRPLNSTFIQEVRLNKILTKNSLKEDLKDYNQEYLFIKFHLSGTLMLKWTILIESWRIILFGHKKLKKTTHNFSKDFNIFKPQNISGLDALTPEYPRMKLWDWNRDNFLFIGILLTKLHYLTTMPLPLFSMQYKF